MILSFAWTTKALLEGRKTVTRRDWAPGYLARWQRAWDRGDRIHDAYDKSPRFGGRCIGQIQLTCRPYLERLCDMPQSDLKAEGDLWADMDDFISLQGGDPDKEMAVLRFELMAVLRFERLGPGPKLL